MLFELLLSASLLFFIYKIIVAINIVESVLFLILLAVNLSFFLFYFCSNFLGILYLAIYIGAVAVFFLFVVMMTDLNSIEFNSFTKTEQKVKYCIVLLASFLFSNLLFSLMNQSPQFNSFLAIGRNSFISQNIDFFYNNVEEIGLSLLNEHSGPFVLTSLIILVALIGAIFLTTIAKQSINNYDFVNPIDSKFASGLLASSNYYTFLNSRHQNMENQIVRSFLNSVNLSLTKK